MQKYLALTAIAFATSLASAPAGAWGREGHEIVAAVAEAHLDPTARAAVAQLLAVEPGATMESVASWADEVRNRTTARWHFVNFPRGDCNYQPPVECRKGECLVSAFDRERAILGDRALPIEEREQALKYIIHLAGDAAQPLHDWGPDRGGNAYQVRFDDRGTNIHHVWDTELIRTYAIEDAGHWGRRPNYRGLTAELVRDSFQLKIPNDQNPVDWVEAGCREAQKPGT